MYTSFELPLAFVRSTECHCQRSAIVNHLKMCYLLRRSVHTEFYIFHAKGLFMSKIKSWCRANAMLVISLLAAIVTAFFVPPDRDYLGYYDLKTLTCLFCVLAVVGALRDLHIFSALSQRMVHTFSTVRGVCTALVVITMFGSMLLTNDTALLTFLPLGWFVLSSTGQEKHTALLFILQNCAANLCGMITPFGNPQNLYLFSYYGLSTKTFFSIMLPPFILSTVLILLCCLAFPKDQLCVPEAQAVVDSRQAAIYGGLFCLAVAMVLRLVPYILGLAVIVLALWLSGPTCAENCRLGIAGHFRRFFHFFRQPCPDGSCSGTVRPPFVSRNHSDFCAYLPDHQQCPCRHFAQPLHAGCPRASSWRQCGRRRNAGGFSGKPYYVSGIYAPRSQWREAFSFPFFWDQLCIPGNSSGCHVRCDGISRFQQNCVLFWNFSEVIVTAECFMAYHCRNPYLYSGS